MRQDETLDTNLTIGRLLRQLWRVEQSVPDPEGETPFWEDADHDVIARYATVGIF